MESSDYFFDTYALVELFEENQSFSPYRDARMFLIDLNLFEMHHYLLKRGLRRDAALILDQLFPFIMPLTKEDIALAAELKLALKQLSPADCLGYVVAQRLGVKFLTGDRAFQGMKDVEWVR